MDEDPSRTAAGEGLAGDRGLLPQIKLDQILSEAAQVTECQLEL